MSEGLSPNLQHLEPSVTVATDQGDRVTCRIDLVTNGSPPTMSRCTAARMRAAISGCFTR